MFDLSKDFYYIIDTSYVMFFVACSAFKQYVYSNDIPKTQLGPDFDPTLDPEFCSILDEKMHYKLENVIREILPFRYDKSRFIFAMDCPRREIWRRELYPEYKLPRDTKDTSKDEFNIGKTFTHIREVVIPNFCDETNSIMVASSCAESDDIIAVVSRHLNEKGKDVIIVSSDRDMVQLHNDKTMIITMMNELRDPKVEMQKMTGIKEIEQDITPNDFLLFKIIIGDGSDNIPAIKKGVGPKRAFKYIADKSKVLLKELLNEDSSIVASFKRNKTLISMNEIPEYVTNLIMENFNESLANRSIKEADEKTLLGEA